MPPQAAPAEINRCIPTGLSQAHDNARRFDVLEGAYKSNLEHLVQSSETRINEASSSTYVYLLVTCFLRRSRQSDNIVFTARRTPIYAPTYTTWILQPQPAAFVVFGFHYALPYGNHYPQRQAATRAASPCNIHVVYSSQEFLNRGPNSHTTRWILYRYVIFWSLEKRPCFDPL